MQGLGKRVAAFEQGDDGHVGGCGSRNTIVVVIFISIIIFISIMIMIIIITLAEVREAVVDVDRQRGLAQHGSDGVQ